MIAWLAIPAFAGGYYYADSGIIANGRGCAYVAGADGQFAQYYNPAGLIRVNRPTFNVGMAGVKQGIEFTRFDADTQTFQDPVQNEGGMFGVPELGFAMPIGDDFAFGFGFTSAFSPAYQFPEDGAQRYTIIDTTIWNFQIGPTVAWRPTKWFAFALGPQWQALRVDEQLKVTISGRDDPSGDVLVDAQTWDKFKPGLNGGVLIEPVKQVSIGAMVQPGVQFDAHGPGVLDFRGNALEDLLDETMYRDDDIALALKLPWFIRTGVAVRPRDNVEVEVDFVYETWSTIKEITVTDIDIHVTGANGFIDTDVESTIELPAGFHDSWSVRLGGEWEPKPWLELRTGGFFERSSLDDDSVSVALIDTPKIMLGAGTSVHVWEDRLVIDSSVSTVFYQDLQIRDSTVSQINVYGGGEAIVGNGDITSQGLAIGLALRWQFTDPLRPRDPWSAPTPLDVPVTD